MMDLAGSMAPGQSIGEVRPTALPTTVVCTPSFVGPSPMQPHVAGSKKDSNS